MTERAKYWQGLLAEWCGSGQTQVAFCRQRRIRAGTFAWWKRQLRQRGLAGDVSAAVGAASGRFVEIPRPTVSPVGFEVLLAGGRTIRVPAGFEEGELARLLSVLEPAC
jgi:hypothetical protein